LYAEGNKPSDNLCDKEILILTWKYGAELYINRYKIGICNLVDSVNGGVNIWPAEHSIPWYKKTV